MVRTGYSRELERDNYARLRRRLLLGAFVSTVAVAGGAAAVFAPQNPLYKADPSDTNPLYKQ